MTKVLPGSNDDEKLVALCAFSYKDQAIWYLNAFWKDMETDAELLWKYVERCSELDDQEHENGCGLDEMKAHVFLEKFDETLTVRALREKLRQTGAIGQTQRPKIVPLIHYLLFKYGTDWHKLVNSAQGDNQEEIEKAQEMLKNVLAALEEAENRAKQARIALTEAEAAESKALAREAEAKQSEADAKASEADAKAKEADAIAKENAAKAAESEALAREAEAKQSEADAKATEEQAIKREAEALEAEKPFKEAQEELQKALAELKKQEEEYAAKIADCEERSKTGGVVQANKAKNELAQLKAEDPLPLRRAKITLESANKRADKARAPFEAATKEAVAARTAASEAASKAAAARAEAEADAAPASAARTAASAVADQATQSR